MVEKGECRSNVPHDGRNAVTWGVFPGKEIVQTTIIERESFLSWKVDNALVELCASILIVFRLGRSILHLDRMGIVLPAWFEGEKPLGRCKGQALAGKFGPS